MVLGMRISGDLLLAVKAPHVMMEERPDLKIGARQAGAYFYAFA
jgi:hypothetical protein